jgi:dihydroorotate dehydrogenase
LHRIKERQAYLEGEHRKHVPVLLKVAPDLSADEITQMATAIKQEGFEGVIVSNTTLSRDGLTSTDAKEQGGMSGAPLKEKADEALKLFKAALGNGVPLVGVGGFTKRFIL